MRIEVLVLLFCEFLPPVYGFCDRKNQATPPCDVLLFFFPKTLGGWVVARLSDRKQATKTIQTTRFRFEKAHIYALKVRSHIEELPPQQFHSVSWFAVFTRRSWMWMWHPNPNTTRRHLPLEASRTGKPTWQTAGSSSRRNPQFASRPFRDAADEDPCMGGGQSTRRCQSQGAP